MAELFLKTSTSLLSLFCGVLNNMTLIYEHEGEK